MSLLPTPREMATVRETQSVLLRTRLLREKGETDEAVKRSIIWLEDGEV